MMLLNDFLREEIKEAGFHKVEVAKTPSGTRITLYVTRPGIVIGRKGSGIKQLTEKVESDFGFKDPQISVEEIQKYKKNSRVVMLTGYGNIPTAVEAVKAGAIDYIPKPADADDVENALLASPQSKAIPPKDPMSADRVKWEHINRIFELCNRNVSETARKLKMHRRTLQRILSKRSPK